jgi:glycogen debranching enzyme
VQVTINTGSTFLIADELGDVTAGNELGLYCEDTRFLSTYQLRLNGYRLRPLATRTPEHYHAVHLLSNPVGGTLQPESLTVVRHRLVGQGLHEDLEVQSYLDEPIEIVLNLRVAADFLHIFQVRGHAQPEELPFTSGSGVTGPLAGAWGLRLSAAGQEYPATEVHFSQPPQFPDSDHVEFGITLGRRGNWRLCVDVLPQASAADRRRPTYSCQRPPAANRTAAERSQRRVAMSAAPRLETDSYPLQEAFTRAQRDIVALQFKGESLDGPAVIAAGIPWFMALFGRDSLIAAYQALPYFPDVAPGVLRALAAEQGTRVEPETEEQPGKIPHEHRVGVLPTPNSLIPRFPYYGTVDATPLFLILLAATYRRSGDLDLVTELWEPAERAFEWIERYGDPDGDGFLEYRRSTPVGLVNQGWKDSWDGIRFQDGRIAEAPIALCEVQGYAYAARRAMAELQEALGQREAARELRQQADTLAAQFDRAFWMPERDYYALALDEKKQQVDGLTSNAGQALWTGIVPAARASLVAEALLGPELFSGWGIRTMGAAEAGYNPVGYHTGTVWPHDNSLIVAGLARYGLHAQASRVIEAQLSATAQLPAYRLPELFAGYSREEYAFVVEYPVACSPQAWAAGAVLLYVTTMLGLDVDAPRRRLRLNPFLPAGVNRLRIAGIRVGEGELEVEVGREYGQLQTRIHRAPPDFQVEGAVRQGGLFW